MTDDSFVFDDDEGHTDDEELFGTHSDDGPAETDRRFGTSATDNTDSRVVGDRLKAVTTGPATVAAALVLVVVLGVVAYPFVLGAFETTDGSNRMTEGRGGGPTAVTVANETATTTMTSRTTAQTTTGRTDTTASPTTNVVPTPTPTSTPTLTPTPVPERGFPAGTPVGTNETDDAAESRTGLSFDSVGGGAGSKHVHESPPRVPSGTGSRLGSQQAFETGVRTPRGRFSTHH